MSDRPYKPGEKIVWPDQATLTRAIKAMKSRPHRNQEYRESAAARRVIRLMGRVGAGFYGNSPLTARLDEKLEKLLM